MKYFLIALSLFATVAFGQQAPRSAFGALNYLQNSGPHFFQRTTSYVSSGTTGYATADRWWHGSNCTSLSIGRSGGQTPMPYSLRFNGTCGAGQEFSWGQRIESSNAALLYGKPVTLSFWYKASASDINTTISNTYAMLAIPDTADTYGAVTQHDIKALNFTADNTWRKATYSFAALPASVIRGLQVQFKISRSANSGTWDIYVQQFMLNEGPTAAPFSLAGGTIGGELALAKRYYRRINSAGTDVAIPGISCVGYTSSLILACATRESEDMRPSTMVLTLGAGLSLFNSSGGAVSCSGKPTTLTTVGSIVFDTCTGVTTRGPHSVVSTTSATGFIAIDAEL
jgi:hypothetical protein